MRGISVLTREMSEGEVAATSSMIENNKSLKKLCIFDLLLPLSIVDSLKLNYSALDLSFSGIDSTFLRSIEERNKVFLERICIVNA
jgi:hypothetical protein